MSLTTRPEKLVRFVVGPDLEFSRYKQLFPGNPANIVKRLKESHQLDGYSPDKCELILLPRSDRWLALEPGLDRHLPRRLEDYARRWSGIGLDKVTEDELRHGSTARQAKLMAKYDKLVAETGYSSIAQAVARGWLLRLRPQDEALIVEIQEKRKAAERNNPS